MAMQLTGTKVKVDIRQMYFGDSLVSYKSWNTKTSKRIFLSYRVTDHSLFITN